MLEPTPFDLNDPRVFDRLVDGELSDHQERALLAQLERTPDGWRRCALAFLEAQCWRRAAIAGQLDATTPEAVQPVYLAAREESPADRRHFDWPAALALCAVVLLALGIGIGWPRGESPLGPTVNLDPSESSQLPDHALARMGARPEDPMVLPSAVGEPTPSDDLLAGNVSFVDHAGQRHSLPVYNWNQQVAQQLMYPTQPLPPEFVRNLKRHEVRSHQSYMPVKLDDGRQVVFPVQEVEILPVSGTAY